MRTRTIIMIMSTLLLAGTASQAGPGTVADLSPELRDALVRDAACSKDSALDAASTNFLQSPVDTQEIHTLGRDLGVIAAFTSGSINCYLRTVGEYQGRPFTPEAVGTIVGTIDM